MHEETADSAALRERLRHVYWIGGGSIEWASLEGTDYHAVDEGYISVTPLHLDLTNHALLRNVAEWELSA